VVTNHHVAGRAKIITCTLSTREEIGADLVGSDALADLAILKLHLNERRDPKAPVPVARFGDSDSLRVGDSVMAMGCPLALSQSVTYGIVSNLDMIMSPRFVGQFELDGEDVGSLVKWIGHDAQIFPGNSGGPLVNLRGEIVGINEIGVGLSGAIPSNLARKVVEELEGCGECKRSWLGMELQPLLRGGHAEKGVLVAGVIEGSPAAAAGLRSGDVLLTYDGTPFTARFLEEIPAVNRRILETPIGSSVQLAISREGQTSNVSVVTQPRGKVLGDEKEFKSWGVTAREITPLAALEMRRAANSGARVSSLRDGGPAADAKPPLQYDDVITQVGDAKIATVADLEKATVAIVKDKSEPVPTLVAFERNRERCLTVVKLGPEPEDSSTDVKKAWFPAAFQVLTTQLAEQMGLAGRTGVRLTQIYPMPGAEAAGLREGDVVVAVEGEAIPAQQVEDMQVFPTMVRQLKIGKASEFTIVRDGQEQKVQVELTARPASGRELQSYKDETFDFTVREISFKDRVDNRWTSEQKGAVIGAVEPGGWAGFSGVAGGELLISLDGKPVAAVDDVKAIMKDVAARKPSHVAFQVRRGIHTYFIEVQPAWPAGK
jgi:serine protease Do